MPSYALILDDHPLVARGVAEFLRSRLPHMEVAVAAHADELAPLIEARGAPAIALIDLWLADGATLHLIAHLRTRCPATAVAVMSGDDDPTVIDQVRPEMTVVREETFGPVSPIIGFADIDEAIAISNGTAYGLSSSVCTQRLDHITRFVNELQVGSVNVREVPGYRLELTPFGGIKDSGLGYKEGVQEAIKSFTNLKTYSLPWG